MIPSRWVACKHFNRPYCAARTSLVGQRCCSTLPSATSWSAIRTTDPAIFIYILVLVSVAAVIKGSMKKSEPVGADWRSDET
jgi:hypothetical protein